MESKNVSELAKQVRGVSYKPEDLHDGLNDKSVILLRANNINDGKINFDDVVYVDKSKVSKEQYLQNGDILICASSGSKQLVGKAASVDFDIECTFGAFCKVVRPNPSIAEFLGIYFQSNTYRQKVSEVAIGANINNIRNEHIDNLILSVGTDEENSEIVRMMKVIQRLIDERKQEVQELDKLVKARFVELFGDPYFNPYKWKKLKIADAVTVEPQNGLYKPQTDYIIDGTGIPILRIDCFYNGEVADWGMLKRLRCTEKDIKRYQLNDDDIVINRVNSIEYLGKCAHITGMKEKTVFESNMMRMHFDKSRFNPIYITKLLCTQYIHDQIIKHAKKAVNQASINQHDVMDFDIYLPPLNMQQEYANFVRQIAKSKAVIEKSLKELETLQASLMQKYFS